MALSMMICWILSLSIISVSFGLPSYKEAATNFNRSQNHPSVVSVVLSENKTLQILNGAETSRYVAQAFFKDSMNETGWSLLKLFTCQNYSDEIQAEAAGMAEGFITANQISMAWRNGGMNSFCLNETDYCKKLKKFLSDNNEWMRNKVQNMEPTSSYWYQISLILHQLKGLSQGYAAAKMMPQMSDFDFFLLQVGSDLEALNAALGKKSTKFKGSGSCSALVKLFENNKDLVISHVTWNDYNAMLRIYKLYNFSFHETGVQESPLINGQVQSFSSYPGLLYSGDDFHILGSGLVTQETTIGNSNKELWKYITSESIFEGFRVIVANRLASGGNSWSSLFEQHNSGTYNNQWMILDYNLFQAGKPLKPDTLWILEQLPGTVHMADMTVLLEEQGYWSSYNIPYFPFVYNISGVAADKKEFGSWFDYSENPRAKIFHRDQKKVIDMKSLVKLMRYNDYKNDPFSKCNCTPPYSAENAISARSDLNPKNGTYHIASLGHRRHGGTDCKATSSSLAKQLAQFIVAGPTYDNQPSFQWSKTEWKKPLGHPDIFQFEPKLLDWQLEDWDVSPDDMFAI